MAAYRLPEMSPWRRQPLTIPPDSWRAWMRLAVWEIWMGVMLLGALGVGTRLIVTAPDSVVTVFDLTKCYAAPPIPQPCERVAYRAGLLNVLMNGWCGVLLIAVAIWLLWELWSAVAPKPITDDFLKLLDDSFGCDWRTPPYHVAMGASGLGLRLHARRCRLGSRRRDARVRGNLLSNTRQAADGSR